MKEIKGVEKATRCFHANTTPRYAELDTLEAYVEGRQYAGRPNFWDADVPLVERAPCINYPLIHNAIESNVDFILGEGRAPTVKSYSSEDDALFDSRFGLSTEDSEIVDRFIQKIIEQARLIPVWREMLEAGMASRSAVAVLGVKQGKLVARTVRAKWCKPKLDPQTDAVLELEVRYPYLETYYDPEQRAWAVRCMLYRRVIDAMRDVTFLPAVARDDGIEPSWAEDPTKIVEHNFKFCPVVWYRNLPRISTCEAIDGEAIHEGPALALADALNFALSQKHRAAVYNGDPQWVECGVEEDHSPSPMGRTGRATILIDPDPKRNLPGYIGVDPSSVTQRTHRAAKKGPGIVWRYPNVETRVTLHSLPGDALTTLDENARDLRAKLCEALGVVIVDPDNVNVAAEFSGKALIILHKRQLARCDGLRADFGDGCMLAMLDMFLRIALTYSDKEDVNAGALYLPGLDKAAPILVKFEAIVGTENGPTTWFAPHIDLVWPAYFAPDALDEQAIIVTAQTAHDAGLITTKSAVERVKDIFNIANVDQYIAELEEENAVKAEAEAEKLDTELAITAKHAPPPPAGKPAAGKPPPKKKTK